MLLAKSLKAKSFSLSFNFIFKKRFRLLDLSRKA